MAAGGNHLVCLLNKTFLKIQIINSTNQVKWVKNSFFFAIFLQFNCFQQSIPNTSKNYRNKANPQKSNCILTRVLKFQPEWAALTAAQEKKPLKVKVFKKF